MLQNQSSNHLVVIEKKQFPCKNRGPVIVVNLNKNDGDLVLCNVYGSRYKIHVNGNIFDLEYLSDQRVFVKPEIDYLQIEKLIELNL